MSKTTKIIVILLVLISLFTMVAEAKDITIMALTNTARFITFNTKDRTQDTWLITILNEYPSTFEAGADVVGFRLWDESQTTRISNYHYFTNFVTNYQLPYTVTPEQGDTLWLRAQADSTSESIGFNVIGKWFT